ncbi:MAG: rhodanese-like domain-containing protein [Pseudomonadota bacterium]
MRFTSWGASFMGTGESPPVGQVDPTKAWQIIGTNSSARLIDVRTRAEWAFVGVPDITELAQEPLFVEWSRYPDMSLNHAFAEEVEAATGSDSSGPLLFICRSGARSLNAATKVADHFARKGVSVTCLNVAEGFEGDLDASGHRGDQNGWKARGLAWRQS